MILGHCLRFPDHIIESDHRFHVEDDLLSVILTSNGMHVLGCKQCQHLCRPLLLEIVTICGVFLVSSALQHWGYDPSPDNR
jgi:hypothetical protein